MGQFTGDGGQPSRYVVLVWMYDHWGVTYMSDDREAAQLVSDQARHKIRTVFVDTRPWERVDH